MPKPAPLPSHLSVNAFSVAEALASGATRKRLRARDLSRPFHGVRVVGTVNSWRDRARAYWARMPDGGRFSHTTAALLHELRMPTGFSPGPLHVTVPGPARAPRVVGVVGHRLTRAIDPVDVDRLPCSSPIDAWIECGTLLRVDDLVIMGDGLLRRRDPIAGLHELERVVASLGAARGSVPLRNALGLLRAGTDSAMETVTRLVLTRAGFPEPEVNGPISSGGHILHGDLVYRAERVVIEYDGEIHRDDDTYFGDIRRLDALMEAGWRVIRVDRRLLRQTDALFDKVRRALGGR